MTENLYAKSRFLYLRVHNRSARTLIMESCDVLAGTKVQGPVRLLLPDMSDFNQRYRESGFETPHVVITYVFRGSNDRMTAAIKWPDRVSLGFVHEIYGYYDYSRKTSLHEDNLYVDITVTK